MPPTLWNDAPRSCDDHRPSAPQATYTMSGSVIRSRTAATVAQPPGSPSARSRDQVRPALTLTHMPPSPSSAYSRFVLWYGEATDTNDAGRAGQRRRAAAAEVRDLPARRPDQIRVLLGERDPVALAGAGDAGPRAAAVLRAVGVRPERRPQRAGEIGRHGERPRVPRHRLRAGPAAASRGDRDHGRHRQKLKGLAHAPTNLEDRSFTAVHLYADPSGRSRNARALARAVPRHPRRPQRGPAGRRPGRRRPHDRRVARLPHRGGQPVPAGVERLPGRDRARRRSGARRAARLGGRLGDLGAAAGRPVPPQRRLPRPRRRVRLERRHALVHAGHRRQRRPGRLASGRRAVRSAGERRRRAAGHHLGGRAAVRPQAHRRGAGGAGRRGRPRRDSRWRARRRPRPTRATMPASGSC